MLGATPIVGATAVRLSEGELNDRARQVVPLNMSFPRLRSLQEHVAYHDARTQRIPMLHKKVACKIATVELPGSAPNFWLQDKEQLTPSHIYLRKGEIYGVGCLSEIGTHRYEANAKGNDIVAYVTAT